MSKTPANAITYDRVREVLHYSPETGVFTWKVNRGRAKAGDRAGYTHPDGYRRIRIDGAQYLEHRIVWLWVYGLMPNQTDHIDHDRQNNRLSNIRNVDRKTNSQNKSMPSNNASGVTGVRFRHSKYFAQINSDGVWYNGKCRSSIEEAIADRREMEHNLGFHPNHGKPALA